MCTVYALKKAGKYFSTNMCWEDITRAKTYRSLKDVKASLAWVQRRDGSSINHNSTQIMEFMVEWETLEIVELKTVQTETEPIKLSTSIEDLGHRFRIKIDTSSIK